MRIAPDWDAMDAMQIADADGMCRVCWQHFACTCTRDRERKRTYMAEAAAVRAYDADGSALAAVVDFVLQPSTSHGISVAARMVRDRLRPELRRFCRFAGERSPTMFVDVPIDMEKPTRRRGGGGCARYRRGMTHVQISLPHAGADHGVNWWVHVLIHELAHAIARSRFAWLASERPARTQFNHDMIGGPHGPYFRAMMCAMYEDCGIDTTHLERAYAEAGCEPFPTVTPEAVPGGDIPATVTVTVNQSEALCSEQLALF